SGLVVLVFSPGDDPVACLNKAMAFLTVVASSRGDNGKIILVLRIRAMQQAKGEILQVDRQELLNATTAKEAGQILDEEQLAFLADPGIPTEVPISETYMNDMDNQSVHALQDFELSLVMDFTDNEISSDSNIISYSQYLQETQ
ncbi:hypothetical protein Tco_1489871, partial [Tanacetum coccineum]